MTIDPIHLGSAPNDGTGQNLRSGGQVINNNFSELDARTATAQAKAEQGVSDAASAKSAALAAQSSADKAQAKLVGIDQGATKNKSDSELLNRSNHTGAQTADTISNFSQAVRTTTLSGVVLSTSPIIEPDTALVAMGKLQGQVNQRVKTGDFGLGGQLVPDVSANAATDTRFYRAYNDADSANLGLVAGLHLQRDPDRSAEISLNWLDESMQFRISNSMGSRGTWRKLVRVGDYGVGAKDNAQWQGEGLNPDTFRTGGTFVGQFNIIGPRTPEWPMTGFLTVAGGSNSSICLQTFRVAGANMGYERSQTGGAWTAWERTFVETVTNANGTATKFPDGTMICRTVRKESGAASIGTGGSLFINGGISFQWPVAFVGEVPVASPSSESYSVGLSWAVLNTAPSITGAADVRIVSPASGALSKVCVVAVGRWS
ncbi:hypothetical protein Q7L38_18060 [Pseudomonas protegens]|uniref:pyocin knob domain-containing protein n=1 Tax=Pseudomonas protegens TaxID=380021 RepID=UPI00275A3966|nr:hypothetical protein [Pseudomonas protegens]MDP9534475.1 hypothetical protein [Pseudomonas protegens]